MEKAAPCQRAAWPLLTPQALVPVGRWANKPLIFFIFGAESESLWQIHHNNHYYSSPSHRTMACWDDELKPALFGITILSLGWPRFTINPIDAGAPPPPQGIRWGAGGFINGGERRDQERKRTEVRSSGPEQRQPPPPPLRLPDQDRHHERGDGAPEHLGHGRLWTGGFTQKSPESGPQRSLVPFCRELHRDPVLVCRLHAGDELWEENPGQQAEAGRWIRLLLKSKPKKGGEDAAEQRERSGAEPLRISHLHPEPHQTTRVTQSLTRLQPFTSWTLTQLWEWS